MKNVTPIGLGMLGCLMAGAVLAEAVTPISPGQSPSFHKLPIQQVNSATEQLPRLFAQGAGDVPVLGDLGVWVGGPQQADIIWNRGTGDLIDQRAGDLLARVHGGEDLKSALSKWRAVRKISQWALRRRLGLTIAPVGVKHQVGDKVSVLVERPATPAFLTVLNLASTGQAQFVFPDTSILAQRGDIIKPGPQMVSIGEAEVTLPVGADHVVAIFTSFRPRDLHALLEEGPSADEVAVALALLASSTDDLRIGVTPIFTLD